MAGEARVRVGVNGYGVIGKRAADAVAQQDDMTLMGVADVVSDYRLRMAVERAYPIFAALPEHRPELEAAGIPVAATCDDLLRQVDVVVDCTPKGVGAKNKARYEAAQVKRARAVLLRRGTDPWESDEDGMLDTVVPETRVPSHRGPMRGPSSPTSSGRRA